MPEFFNSSLGVKLTMQEAVDEVIRFMQDEPRYIYSITLGTDSLCLANDTVDFVTAFVVHRVGNGGRYFWRRAKLGKFHTLRDRIIQEVLISIDFGKLFLEALQERAKQEQLPEWSFELHADIGENGPTKAMLQEVTGMIRAYNFEVRTKPYSYAATTIADKHV